MTVNDLKINEFQNNNKILIPSDLKQYFLLINGSNDMPLYFIALIEYLMNLKTGTEYQTITN